jgi:glc operon protein GlcG
MRAFLIPLAIFCFTSAAAAQPQPAPVAQAQPAYANPVTLAQARRIADAAEEAARGRDFAMAFAIVDPSGGLILFHKMDGTQNGSIEVAIQKARTSALFRRPTRAFSESVAAGRNAVLSLPNVVAIEGGVPIMIDGRVAGAIGVSGGSSEQDGEIAAAALAAALRDQGG